MKQRNLSNKRKASKGISPRTAMRRKAAAKEQDRIADTKEQARVAAAAAKREEVLAMAVNDGDGDDNG